jgi:hypothetical protein
LPCFLQLIQQMCEHFWHQLIMLLRNLRERGCPEQSYSSSAQT